MVEIIFVLLLVGFIMWLTKKYKEIAWVIAIAFVYEKEIKKILSERYGEYILFKPYFNSKNLFLWLFPFILVILSIIILLKNSKKTRS